MYAIRVRSYLELLNFYIHNLYVKLTSFVFTCMYKSSTSVSLVYIQLSNRSMFFMCFFLLIYIYMNTDSKQLKRTSSRGMTIVTLYKPVVSILVKVWARDSRRIQLVDNTIQRTTLHGGVKSRMPQLTDMAMLMIHQG